VPNINIRDVHPDFVIAVKVAASREGITLKDYTLRALAKAVKESRKAGLLPKMSDRVLAEAEGLR
jgi:hypothetical protein